MYYSQVFPPDLMALRLLFVFGLVMWWESRGPWSGPVDKINASAQKFNVDKVNQQDVAKAGGGPPPEED